MLLKKYREKRPVVKEKGVDMKKYKEDISCTRQNPGKARYDRCRVSTHFPEDTQICFIDFNHNF